MVAQDKVVKYTPEVVARITQEYTRDSTLETVHKLAAELNVSERSLIAKLSALGIYKKKQYVTKQGTAPIKKEVYIQKIAAMLTIDVQLLECMEKCTKQSLQQIHDRVYELIHEEAPPTPVRG